MDQKLSASLKTFGKYVFWTAMAAAIQAAINGLSGIELPLWMVPLLGAALKAAATYVATQVE